MDSKCAVIGVLVRKRDKDVVEETDRAHVVTEAEINFHAASQGLPKIVSKHRKGGGSVWTGPSPQPSRHSMAYSTSIGDF